MKGWMYALIAFVLAGLGGILYYFGFYKKEEETGTAQNKQNPTADNNSTPPPSNQNQTSSNDATPPPPVQDKPDGTQVKSQAKPDNLQKMSAVDIYNANKDKLAINLKGQSLQVAQYLCNLALAAKGQPLISQDGSYGKQTSGAFEFVRTTYKNDFTFAFPGANFNGWKLSDLAYYAVAIVKEQQPTETSVLSYISNLTDLRQKPSVSASAKPQDVAANVSGGALSVRTNSEAFRKYAMINVDKLPKEGITLLQKALNKTLPKKGGYIYKGKKSDSVAVDGDFGPRTKTALAAMEAKILGKAIRYELSYYMTALAIGYTGDFNADKDKFIQSL